MNSTVHDVLIMGGGLAGLTLALQLKQAMPDLDIRVIERRHHPVPAAAHKIGESSVEIGAHYFAEVLGLKAHLDAVHLRKFGFRFFFSEGTDDLAGVTELGASRYLSAPSWQIDRGLFENFLAQEARRRGVQVDCGTAVRRIELDGAAGHTVEVERLPLAAAADAPAASAASAASAATPATLRARWLIDAAGRVNLLKRRLDLAQDNTHAAHAVWFRLNARLSVDQWVSDPAWQARCTPAARWQSTNHLCGKGYWLWLIPLGSGAHSVGIVADPAEHPLADMNTFERALAWITAHQPAAAAAIRAVLAAQPDALLDFAFLKRFSHGCKKVFSAERWALTGDAGLFLDPFYSPGSDFIAMSNTYITALVQHDRAGESLRAPALLYGEVYRSLYESTLTLYTDQYRLFGNARVLPLKVLWDYTYYWGVLCQLFFQGRLTDRALLNDLAEPLQRARQLNAGMQDFLRAWGDHDDAQPAAGRPVAQMLDQAALPWFAALNRSLLDGLDDAGVRARLRANVAQLAQLAAQITERALRAAPHLAGLAPAGLPPCDGAALLFAETA